MHFRNTCTWAGTCCRRPPRQWHNAMDKISYKMSKVPGPTAPHKQQPLLERHCLPRPPHDAAYFRARFTALRMALTCRGSACMGCVLCSGRNAFALAFIFLLTDKGRRCVQ